MPIEPSGVETAEPPREFQPHFEGVRVFMPLGISGCGFGCRYCYVADPATPATPLTAAELRSDLERVGADPRFRPGGDGTMIAIGCDTEPFRTDATTALAIDLMDGALGSGNPVQIATKSRLPAAVVERLAAWPEEQPAPVVFTSLTTVTKAGQIEPGAPCAEERAGNFGHRPRRWVSAAMIKPLLPATHRDAAALVDLLARTQPDYVVLGVRYRREGGGDEAHPLAVRWRGVELEERDLALAERLRAAGLTVIHHSLCVSALANDSSHALEVFRERPKVCAACGHCDRLDASEQAAPLSPRAGAGT